MRIRMRSRKTVMKIISMAKEVGVVLMPKAPAKKFAVLRYCLLQGERWVPSAQILSCQSQPTLTGQRLTIQAEVM